MFIFLILGLILGALIIIFALQNVTTVTLVFLTWQFEGSLALIFVLAVASGIVLCLFLSLPEVIRKRFLISKLKKKTNILEEELTEKKIEVEAEKSKVEANNAYLDDLEKHPNNQ
ncbi:MAG: LapA family protein [Candidatus Taylorbacteria bacterium]|nr:LapA family protein [Candidatus Taylorbacteria bacterium]